MSPLEQAVFHFNTSHHPRIDEATLVNCVKSAFIHEEWVHHVISFFLETPIQQMHQIVLSRVFSFDELHRAHILWDRRGCANGETTEWIKEMAYLKLGKAAELGIARFI